MSAVAENEFLGKIPAEMVDFAPEVGLVLGSGLGSLVDRVEVTGMVPYSRLALLPPPLVPGHAGRFVLAKLGGARVVIAQGRSHLYEGHPAAVVTAGIRCLHAAGVKRLVLTNAAGTVNPDFIPGNWMAITDQLNLTGTTPLLGGANFVDMSEIYSATWRGRFRGVAEALGLTLHEGVYAGLLGPQYETPAEVCMLRRLGGDAVGMSTVVEAIAARALGIEVAGFSCLTNWGAGLGDQCLDHAEVMEVGEQAADSLLGLLEGGI